jgi:pimeloyl-ACP methyl ester carboxylesterase
MRWFHEGVDRLYIGVTRRVVPAVFRRGSVSAPLRDHLAAVELRTPLLASPGRQSLTARTMVGEVQAGFRWRPASSANRPVLIFHHGLGEIPYDFTLRRMFRRTSVDAHLVAIRAPFHQSYADCCRGLASLERFMTMCAVSVTLIEALRRTFVQRGAHGSIVAGISLGGFVALLHHLSHGTASRYAPLLAGPDLAYTLLSTPCRGFLAAQALADPDSLTACLDFRRAFQASGARRIAPLLARHDLWMPYTRHQPMYAAKSIPVATIDRGHMTGSWAFAALREHLLSMLRTLPDAEAVAEPEQQQE